MIIIHHMPPKNTHGWHSTPTLARCFSAPRLPLPLSPMSLPPASMSPLAPYSLLCMRGLCTSSARKKQQILQQFMFGIRVIESHSYIKVRKVARWRRYKCEVGIHENVHASLPLFLVLEQCLPSFFILSLSPLL